MNNLNDSILLLKGIGKKTFEYYKQANILTVSDLLYTFPKKYNVYELISIKDAKDEEKVTIEGVICSNPISLKYKKAVDNLMFTLETENIKIKVFMFGKGYLKYSLRKNMKVTIYGIYKKNRKEIVATEAFVENFKERIEPVYGLKNINDSQITKLISNLDINSIEITDELPEHLVEKYRLLTKKDFIAESHFPICKESIRQIVRRKKYEEYFKYCLQIEAMNSYVMYNRKICKSIPYLDIERFINQLPFELTTSQRNTIDDISKDMGRSSVMNRLIQGDVGCGKTIVAIVASLINTKNQCQTVIMAPTEILAKQHYNEFRKYLDDFNISIEIMTSSTKQSKRKEIILGLEKGHIDILISTHSVLYHDIDYYNLGLLIVDEQHRFGVEARRFLLRKYEHSDAIYMSATPIPRTLGLTKFGDMDISSMHERPSVRKTVKTKVMSYDDLEIIFDDLEQRIIRNEQAFLVVSQIEDHEMNLMDIDTLKDMISEKFPNIKIGTLHGGLTSETKNKRMLDFANKKYDILITTTVIEVGIDIKNATGIYIFDADRFGLSTLHQLRGRVGRNDMDSYCALITKNVYTDRLLILENTNDCFTLAEEDLRLRGPGELLGDLQSGFVGLDFNQDINIFKCAKEDAYNCFMDVVNKRKDYKLITNIIQQTKNTKLN